MATSFITTTEFKTFRDIGKKIDIDKASEAIKLAQGVDLYDVLGNFLFNVLDNLESASYADLMTGSTFTYNDTTYQHDGLKSLLADYAYARYVASINVNFTPFGAVKKISQDSEPVDRNTIRDTVKLTQQDASIKFSFINKYLLSDTITFADYCTGNNPDINTFGQRFSIIGK